jgi:hypothetical protein
MKEKILRTIDHQELKQKMDHDESFRLVMALQRFAPRNG